MTTLAADGAPPDVELDATALGEARRRLVAAGLPSTRDARKSFRGTLVAWCDTTTTDARRRKTATVPGRQAASIQRVKVPSR